MITSSQTRAARALLGWSQSDLATAAGIARRTITHFENDSRLTNEDTRSAIESAFERNGVIIMVSDRGEGVFRQATP